MFVCKERQKHQQWGFVKGNVYVPPLPTLHELQTLIRKFSTTCGRKLKIDLMLLEPLVALTLNFIKDKLLFIKLFQSVFKLMRVL
jgi:hypothetical protein